MSQLYSGFKPVLLLPVIWISLELFANIKQLLDEVEQNIVICQWQADQLFADAEGRGK